MLKWFFASVLFALLHKETVSLEVNVSGFPSNKGQAYVALFNSSETFPSYGKQLKGKIVEISQLKCKVTFANLNSGSYAIAVYHDVNKNDKLDKNVLGMPTESYGFSNNARATFSAPSYQDAKVSCTKDRSINITVK
jgi:uncharacterized protein (DUF2141 family)